MFNPHPLIFSESEWKAGRKREREMCFLIWAGWGSHPQPRYMSLGMKPPHSALTNQLYYTDQGFGKHLNESLRLYIQKKKKEYRVEHRNPDIERVEFGSTMEISTCFHIPLS